MTLLRFRRFVEKPPFDWALAGRTLLAVVGLVLVLFGAVELGVVLAGEGGRPLLGAAVLLAGLVAAGIPIYLGFRQAIEAKRRGET